MEGGGFGSHGVVSRLSLIPTVSFWVFSPESHHFLIVPSVISDLLGSVCWDNKPLGWRLGQIGGGDWQPQDPSSLYRTFTLCCTLSPTLPFSGSLLESRVEKCRTGLLAGPSLSVAYDQNHQLHVCFPSSQCQLNVLSVLVSAAVVFVL